MNFNEFQQECTRTANPNINWEQANLNWALGIAGEAGEYCELIKKHTFHGKKPLNLDAAKKELGDVLFYVAMAAKNLHLSLDEVAKANLQKLRARYPKGFEEGGGIRNNDHEDDAN
jgi:NTP pyrophosphatase (non-canonical NTP hydrolase)|tara:strand:+ start:424 stop:771 length:348 start_codon:yes stop_codon:yes gene_type:complete